MIGTMTVTNGSAFIWQANLPQDTNDIKFEYILITKIRTQFPEIYPAGHAPVDPAVGKFGHI